MAPLLSALADGEANPKDLGTLRLHLRGCSTCRATLRAYREVPRDTAALLPAAAAAVDGRGGSVSRWFEGVLGWTQERASLAAMKVQAAFEGSTTGKLAAVAASAVAIASGTIVAGSLEDVAPAKPPGDERNGGRLELPSPPELVAGAEAEPAVAAPASVPQRLAATESAASPPANTLQTSDAPVDPIAAQRSREVSARPTTVPTDPGNPVRGPREREIQPMLVPLDGGSSPGGSGTGQENTGEPQPAPAPAEPGSGDGTTVDGGEPPPSP